MIRILIIIYLSLCCYTFSFAQHPDTSKSLLWKISNAEMKKPSYLFGTIHMICPEDYLWTPKMQQSFESADEVCFEMDMDDPMLMMTIARGMMSNNHKELKDYFTTEQYKKIEQYIRDSINMDISMFSQLKPSALQTVFATKIAGCPSPLTYELVLTEEAKKHKKEISGLEEAYEQIELLNNMPTDSIVYGLIDMIDNDSNTKAEFQAMVSVYKNQDINLLLDIIRLSKDMSSIMTMFLDDRNIKWIERMIEKMDQSSVFFAVGAGHLPGQNGIISLLRNAGYRVEAIK